MWAIPLENRYSQTITNEFRSILTISKRKPLKIESDRGTDFHHSIFQNFPKSKRIQLFSRYTNRGPTMAERVNKALCNFLKTPVILTGNADWLSQLPSVTRKLNNTNHSSIKMTPNRASKKSIGKEVCFNLQDKRRKLNIKFKLGQLVRTADIKRVFSKGDSTNYSYNLYTRPEIINDTIPSYRIDYLPEGYKENLLLPTKLTSEDNNEIKKKLNLIQEHFK